MGLKSYWLKTTKAYFSIYAVCPYLGLVGGSDPWSSFLQNSEKAFPGERRFGGATRGKKTQ